MNESCHTYEWVMSNTWMSHVTHINDSCRTHHTGWRRPIGCLQLQVIFSKRANDYRALLRKMTCKDKASCGSSPPCIHEACHAYKWVLYTYKWVLYTWGMSHIQMSHGLMCRVYAPMRHVTNTKKSWPHMSYTCADESWAHESCHTHAGIWK